MNENNLQSICQASLIVKKCMEDNDYLCEKLNEADPKMLRDIYKSDRSGVVVDIRKDIAREILLGDLTTEKMMNIISNHKSKNIDKLKAWSNPYRILHPIINHSFTNIDKFIIEFVEEVKLKIGDVKYTICNFNGSQHQGSDAYWIAFYNSNYESQSEGLQIFIEFKNGYCQYGIYDHHIGYKIGPIEFNNDEFYKFIEENKVSILEDNGRTYMTFINAAIYILEKNGNKPMTSNDIWSEISKERLVKTSGKTPSASLNTIILSNCLDTPITSSSKSRNIFKIIGSHPMKFQLNNYMPKNIKDTMIKNGFITIEQLSNILEEQEKKFKEILSKHNIIISD